MVIFEAAWVVVKINLSLQIMNFYQVRLAQIRDTHWNSHFLKKNLYVPVCYFLPCLDRNISPHDSLGPPFRCASFTWRNCWWREEEKKKSFLWFIGKKEEQTFLGKTDFRCTCTCSSSVSVSRSGLQIVFSTLSAIESVTLAEKKGEKIKLMKYWKTTNLM